MLASFERIVMDGISDMVFVIKVENNEFSYEFLNKAAVEKSNLGNNVIGLPIRDIYPPNKAQILYDQYANVASTKKCHVYEDSYSDASGRQCYTESTMTPLFDEDGYCYRIVTVVRDITKVKEELGSMKEQIDRLTKINEGAQSLFIHNSDGILSFDLLGKITNGNLAIETITGYKIAELMGLPFEQFVTADHKKTFRKLFKASVTGENCSSQLTIKNKSGEIIDIQLKVVPLIIGDKIIGTYAIFKDITEQLLIIEKLEQSEKRFRIITENAQDLITLINHEGKIMYVSPSYKKILGYHHDEYIDKLFIHNIYPNDIESLTKKISQACQKAEPFNAEFRQYNSNGELLWFESNGQPIFNQKGALEYLVVLTRDITLRKEYESKLRHFAYHDSLTGLPNRLSFKEKFSAAKEYHLQKKDGLALILLDIDNFKLINDTMGHDFGDLVIKEFGNRLCQTIRGKGIVARLGGDEFIILVPNINSKNAIIKIADDIFNTMKKPLNISGEVLEITTSMGIAIAPIENFSKKSLLKSADIALYKAKENGKNSYFIYEDDEK